MKKVNHSVQKLEAVTFKTLVVGVDIAKHIQWTRFVDCRGLEHSKAIKFENNRNVFNTILARIYQICKDEDFDGSVKLLWNFLLTHGDQQMKTNVSSGDCGVCQAGVIIAAFRLFDQTKRFPSG